MAEPRHWPCFHRGRFLQQLGCCETTQVFACRKHGDTCMPTKPLPPHRDCSQCGDYAEDGPGWHGEAPSA